MGGAPSPNPLPRGERATLRLAVLILSPPGRGRDPTPLGGGRVRGGTHRIQYDFHHALCVCQHVIVPETQNPIALLFQKCCAARIGCRPRIMLTTIEFDDKHVLGTNEIRDEGTNRKLATEFEIAEGTIAQMQPEAILRVGLIDAKTAGTRNVLTSRHERPLTQPSPQRGEG